VLEPVLEPVVPVLTSVALASDPLLPCDTLAPLVGVVLASSESLAAVLDPVGAPVSLTSVAVAPALALLRSPSPPHAALARSTPENHARARRCTCVIVVIIAQPSDGLKPRIVAAPFGRSFEIEPRGRAPRGIIIAGHRLRLPAQRFHASPGSPAMTTPPTTRPRRAPRRRVRECG
jgi:hypothetical protein